MPSPREPGPGAAQPTESAKDSGHYLDDLGPAGSWLVEHGDPAHANPAAQVPAAWSDDRPPAGGGAMDREHRFADGRRAPHFKVGQGDGQEAVEGRVYAVCSPICPPPKKARLYIYFIHYIHTLYSLYILYIEWALVRGFCCMSAIAFKPHAHVPIFLILVLYDLHTRSCIGACVCAIIPLALQW